MYVSKKSRNCRELGAIIFKKKFAKKLAKNWQKIGKKFGKKLAKNWQKIWRFFCSNYCKLCIKN
jgi:hypothetical protein